MLKIISKIEPDGKYETKYDLDGLQFTLTDVLNKDPKVPEATRKYISSCLIQT